MYTLSKKTSPFYLFYHRLRFGLKLQANAIVGALSGLRAKLLQ